ncbi:MAG: hypothetical protein ABIH39_05625 [Candidatus Margulisiibacteriota bacterium]
MANKVGKLIYVVIFIVFLSILLWQNTKDYDPMIFPNHIFAAVASFFAIALLATLAAYIFIVLTKVLLRIQFSDPIERFSIIMYTMIIITLMWREMR